MLTQRSSMLHHSALEKILHRWKYVRKGPGGAGHSVPLSVCTASAASDPSGPRAWEGNVSLETIPMLLSAMAGSMVAAEKMFSQCQMVNANWTYMVQNKALYSKPTDFRWLSRISVTCTRVGGGKGTESCYTPMHLPLPTANPSIPRGGAPGLVLATVRPTGALHKWAVWQERVGRGRDPPIIKVGGGDRVTLHT
jgi:hypothetical protein